MLNHEQFADTSLTAPEAMIERGYVTHVFFSGYDCFAVFSDGKAERLHRLLIDGSWAPVELQ